MKRISAALAVAALAVGPAPAAADPGRLARPSRSRLRLALRRTIRRRMGPWRWSSEACSCSW